MKTLYTHSLSDDELSVIVAGGDSFGKDVGQFVGGTIGTYVSLPWWIAAFPGVGVAMSIYGGIAAATA